MAKVLPAPILAFKQKTLSFMYDCMLHIAAGWCITFMWISHIHAVYKKYCFIIGVLCCSYFFTNSVHLRANLLLFDVVHWSRNNDAFVVEIPYLYVFACIKEWLLEHWAVAFFLLTSKYITTHQPEVNNNNMETVEFVIKCMEIENKAEVKCFNKRHEQWHTISMWTWK